MVCLRVLLLLCCSALPSHAAMLYYLNPASGSNSSSGVNPTNSPAGTGPWKTIDKVATTVVGGDTVNIVAGSYTNAQIFDDGTSFYWTSSASHHKGSAGAPITIQANGTDVVTIDGLQRSSFVNFYPSVTTDYYVIFNKLRFTNYAGSVINGFSDVPGSVRPRYWAVIGCTFDTVSNWQSAPVTAGPGEHYIVKDNTIRTIGALPSLGDGSPELQHFVYISTDAQYGVFDGNVMEGDSGFGLHFYGHGNHSVTTRNSIIRRNTVVNGHEGLLIFSATEYLNTYVYHNTFWQDAVPYGAFNSLMAPTSVQQYGTTNLVNTVIKNNAGSGYTSTAPVLVPSSASFQDPLTLDYNAWTNLNASANVVSWDGVTYTLTGFRTATGYEQHGTPNAPQFVNAAGRDFTLQPTSTLINTGDFLTRTSSAKTSSTALDVLDAGYFHDGYGMIVGDTIQIEGSTPAAPVRISSIAGNTITLTSPRTWSNSTGVSLPWSENRPDIGAFEAVTTASPVTVHVVPSTGSDSVACTSAGLSTPRQTLAGGLACLNIAPGSTLYLHAGTYPSINSDTVTILGGTDWNNPTTIAAYNNELVTLTTSTPGAAVIRLADGTNNHYIVLDGLTLDAQNTTDALGLRLAGVSHIWFQRGTIKNTPDICVYMSTSGTDNHLEATRLTGCSDGTYIANQTSPWLVNNVAYANTSRGLTIANGTTGAQVLFNSVSGNAVRGVNIVSGATNTTVRNNILYNNGVEYLDESPGVSVGNIQDHNLLTNPQWESPGTGNFHLTAASAALGASGPVGTGVAVAQVPRDVENNVRADPPALGAYEYLGPPVVVPPSVSSRLPTAQPSAMFLAR